MRFSAVALLALSLVQHSAAQECNTTTANTCVEDWLDAWVFLPSGEPGLCTTVQNASDTMFDCINNEAQCPFGTLFTICQGQTEARVPSCNVSCGSAYTLAPTPSQTEAPALSPTQVGGDICQDQDAQLECSNQLFGGIFAVLSQLEAGSTAQCAAGQQLYDNYLTCVMDLNCNMAIIEQDCEDLAQVYIPTCALDCSPNNGATLASVSILTALVAVLALH